MLFLSSGHQACSVPDDRPVSGRPGARDLQPHREGHYHILIFTFNINMYYFKFQGATLQAKDWDGATGGG